MSDFYKPDFESDSGNPFARDNKGKLVRANYWLDMSDKSIILIMTHGIGAHLPNSQEQLHLIDIKREHLIEDICVQEILPPET